VICVKLTGMAVLDYMIKRMTELHLVIVPEMRALYEMAVEKYLVRPMEERDSGFDLFCDREYFPDYNSLFLKFGVKAACAVKPGAALVNRAYWLMPRSSMSKRPFICSNSMGLIDSGYRGEIMGAVRLVTPPSVVGEPSYNPDSRIEPQTRLFQLVSGSLKPWASIVLHSDVATLPQANTMRGTGGFGSTGTN
jgi:dUTP pyrophosphatase